MVAAMRWSGWSIHVRGPAYQSKRDIYKWQYANPNIGAGASAPMVEILPTTAAQPGPAPANPSRRSWTRSASRIFPLAWPALCRSTRASRSTRTAPIFVPGDPEGALLAQLNDGYNYKINAVTGTWGQNDMTTRMSNPLTRYSLFTSAHYDFTDSIRFYTQATFAKSKSEYLSTPALIQFNSALAIPYDRGVNYPVPAEVKQLLDSRADAARTAPYAVAFPTAT